jgi:hypothetical protein
MAQQVVTELVIDADTSGADRFTQAMNGAEQAAKNGTEATGGLGVGLAAIGTGAVAAVFAVKEFMDQIAAANKGLADMQTLANRVGLTLSDFQGVQFGAAIAGLSPQQINTGLEKSAQLLNDASRNSNNLSKELEANGISIRNANGQLISQNQLLGIAADLIRKARNPGDQDAIAQMLGFSKEWVPLLEQGSGAMAALTSEAKKAGAVIDDETVQRASKFDQDWRRSSVEFSLYMKSAMLGLLPYLDDLIERAQRFINSIDRKKVEDAAKEQLAAAGEASGIPKDGGIRIGWTDETTQAMKEFNDTGKSWWEQANAGIAALKSLFQYIPQEQFVFQAGSEQQIQDTSPSSIANMASWQSQAQSWKQLQGEFLSGADNISGAFSKVATRGDAANDAVDRAINTLRRHTEQQMADAQAVGLGDGALSRYRAVAAETAAVQANQGKETDAQRAAFEKQRDAAEAAATALAKAKVQSSIEFNGKTAFLSAEDVSIANQLKGIYGNDVPAALDSTYAAAIRVNNAFRQVSTAIETNLTSGLTDIAMGTKTASQGFKDMSQAVIRALEEMIIKVMVVKPLMDSLQSSIGGSGILSFLTGGSGSAAQASSAATLAGNTGGAFYGPGFADGTDYAPGGWALVGERGPEIVNLPQGSQVLPNGKMPSNDNTTVHMGGINLIVNGNVDDRNMSEIKQQLVQLEARVPALAVNAVQTAKKQRRI